MTALSLFLNMNLNPVKTKISFLTQKPSINWKITYQWSENNNLKVLQNDSVTCFTIVHKSQIVFLSFLNRSNALDKILSFYLHFTNFNDFYFIKILQYKLKVFKKSVVNGNKFIIMSIYSGFATRNL